jgi:hypothetical protein
MSQRERIHELRIEQTAEPGKSSRHISSQVLAWKLQVRRGAIEVKRERFANP